MENAAPTHLSDPDIELVAVSYTRQMARFEDAALVVEQRLRRELRANAVRSLLSSRAKHPDDLRGKLRKKRNDARYVLARLLDRIDDVVTDLAGCRVLVYQPSDIEKVRRVILAAFDLASVTGSDELHDKSSGYRARHLLVEVPESEERQSLRGTFCEIQIATLGAHVFNELEHDIAYKEHGVPPGDAEAEALRDVQAASRLLDRTAERLLLERGEAVTKQTVPLRDSEDLQLLLERLAGRKLHGEFDRLFRFLETFFESLTAAAVDELGGADLITEGRARAENLGIEEADDVTCMALALHGKYPGQLESFVKSQRGRSTLFKQAVEKAAASKGGAE